MVLAIWVGFNISFHTREVGIDGCPLTVDTQPRRSQMPQP